MAKTLFLTNEYYRECFLLYRKMLRKDRYCSHDYICEKLNFTAARQKRDMHDRFNSVSFRKLMEHPNHLGEKIVKVNQWLFEKYVLNKKEEQQFYKELMAHTNPEIFLPNRLFPTAGYLVATSDFLRIYELAGKQLVKQGKGMLKRANQIKEDAKRFQDGIVNAEIKEPEETE